MFKALIYWNLFFVFIGVNPGHAFEYEVHRIVKEIDPDKIWNIENLKAKKVRKGATAFDGNAELLQTLNGESKFNVKAYYSSNGSDKYELLPHHLDPGSVCDFLNNDYKKYVPDLHKFSDFPEIKDEKYCPLKKGKYNIQKYEWDASSLPAIFKSGYYKVQLNFEVASGDKSSISVFMKVNQ